MDLRCRAQLPHRAAASLAAPRRAALLGTLLLLLLLPAAVRATPTCSAPDARGVQACRAGLQAHLVARMQQQQERPRWCWAAALAMVMARYGHVVRQDAIVERWYGEAVDVGVPTHLLPDVIAGASDSVMLRAVTRVQAAAPGETVPVSASLLITSLAAGRPLILSSHGHAVVVVAISYEARGRALRLTGGTVLDPQPGVGLRPLRRDEFRVALLASVDVAPAVRHVALR